MILNELTPDERNAVLKAVSVHIISLRKRVERPSLPPEARVELDREHDLCVLARNKLEAT